MAWKVLIVDDDPDNVSYLKDVLDDHGYETLCASDGLEGLRRAREDRPDLILLDLMMPKKSGIGMFQELKAQGETQGIPVVIITGVSQATGVDFKNFLVTRPGAGEDRRVGTEGATKFTAAAGYVEKPVDPDQLLKLVGEILGR
jgi:CheY-like chemotaxis protein